MQTFHDMLMLYCTDVSKKSNNRDYMVCNMFSKCIKVCLRYMLIKIELFCIKMIFVSLLDDFNNEADVNCLHLTV